MKIGVVINQAKNSSFENLNEFRRVFSGLGMECLLDTRSGELMKEKGLPLLDLAEEVEAIVVLGGDGTLLQVGENLRGKNVLLAGVNIGNIGFLSTCEFSEISLLGELILKKEYQLIKRFFLEIEISSSSESLYYYVLNEVVFSRGSMGRLIELNVSINGKFLDFYRADGIIISTPTGSTAYSLSAGGPIVHPDSGVLLLNPICPYAFDQRPLIVGDKSEIEVFSRNSQRSVTLSFDGHFSHELNSNSVAKIRKTNQFLSFIHISKEGFFEFLRRKFQR